MEKEAGLAALVVHARGWAIAPADCREAADHDLESVERVVALLGGGNGQKQLMQVNTGGCRIGSSSPMRPPSKAIGMGD